MQLRDIAKPKFYEPPTMRTRELSQAILFLVGYAYIGDVGASNLLELLFPDPNPIEYHVVQGSELGHGSSLAREKIYCTGAFNAATSSTKLLAFTARSTASRWLKSSLASPSKSRCD